jgi:Flp pilus assembly protein TadB
MQTEQRSIPELTKAMAFHLGDMFRNELKLARTEATEGVKSMSGAFGLFAWGMAFGAAALTAGVFALAYLLSTFMPMWTSLAIVAIGVGITGWMLIQAAHKAIRTENLSLPKTREQVSRDLKTLSERVH